MDTNKTYATSRVDDAALLCLHGWYLTQTSLLRQKVVFTLTPGAEAIDVSVIVRKVHPDGAPMLVDVNAFIRQQQILKRQIRELLGVPHGEKSSCT